MVKNLPAMQETPLDQEDPLKKRIYSSPLPLQYSCLENFTDRGAWRAIVHGVTKHQTLSLSSLLHPFIHLFNKYSVSTKNAPGTVQGTRRQNTEQLAHQMHSEGLFSFIALCQGSCQNPPVCLLTIKLCVCQILLSEISDGSGFQC